MASSTRKSATSARLTTPNCQRWRGQDAVAASCRPICQQAWAHDGPVEPGGLNNPLLDILVVIDTFHEQGKDDCVVEETAMTAAVAGAETGHGNKTPHSCG